MIVRRLCVTPAVGSLMQRLFTKRNRTTDRTNRGTARQQHGVQIPQGVLKMSQAIVQTELQEKTQQLLVGPLKHIRAAALAAALLPLASVAAAPASAQNTFCASGGVCGFVFNDANNNGIQDAGELGIAGAVVTVSSPDGSFVIYTD